jgi:hypothetical protein
VMANGSRRPFLALFLDPNCVRRRQPRRTWLLPLALSRKPPKNRNSRTRKWFLSFSPHPRFSRPGNVRRAQWIAGPHSDSNSQAAFDRRTSAPHRCIIGATSVHHVRYIRA